MCVTSHAQNNHSISRKTWGMKLIFCLQISTNVFCKMIVSLWVCVSTQARITQNNKFVLFSEYPKEKVKNEVDTLTADKCQSFPSNWYYHFSCVWTDMPKLPKIACLLFLCDILRKKWVMKLIFCVISMKVPYKLIPWFLMRMVKHFQSSKNSKFAMSLQY